MTISNMTLVKIASVGGVITVSMGYLLRAKIGREICQTDYYKDAMKTLRAHKGAIHLLGEPIKDYTVDVGDNEKNYTKNLSAHYEIPVKGPKSRGTVFFWANRTSLDDKWTVNRIELQLKKDPDKRLLIKNVDTKGV